MDMENKPGKGGNCSDQPGRSTSYPKSPSNAEITDLLVGTNSCYAEIWLNINVEIESFK